MDLSLMKLLNVNEIPLILEKAAPFGGILTQPNLTTNVSSMIKRMEVCNDGKITIKLFEQITLKDDKPIVINLSYRDCSFKLNAGQYLINVDTIITELPREARALPLRDDERFVLPLNSNINLSLHRVEKRERSSDLDAIIIDFSRFGVGIKFPGLREGTLLKHDHVWIREINGIMLEQPLFGKIVYVSEIKYLSSSDCRVGISLESPIPEEMFKRLQKKCKMVLTA